MAKTQEALKRASRRKHAVRYMAYQFVRDELPQVLKQIKEKANEMFPPSMGSERKSHPLGWATGVAARKILEQEKGTSAKMEAVHEFITRRSKRERKKISKI